MGYFKAGRWIEDELKEQPIDELSMEAYYIHKIEKLKEEHQNMINTINQNTKCVKILNNGDIMFRSDEYRLVNMFDRKHVIMFSIIAVILFILYSLILLNYTI
jgi:hypothetical protein